MVFVYPYLILWVSVTVVSPPVSEDQGPQGGAIRGLPAEIIEMTSITCTAWRHAARALSTLPGHYCIRIEWWTNPVVT